MEFINLFIVSYLYLVIISSISGEKSYHTRFIPTKNDVQPNNLTIKIAVLLTNDSEAQCAMYKVLPAIDVAIDYIRNKYLLLSRYSFSLSYADIKSDLALGPLTAVDIFNGNDANVMLGPTDNFILANIGRYSSFRYNIPILSAGGFASELGNKKKFPMLTRLAGTYDDISRVFYKIFDQFGWSPKHHKTLIVWYIWNKNTNYLCNFQTKPIIDRFRQHGFKMDELSEDLTVMDINGLKNRSYNTLKSIKKSVRLIILCSINRQYVRDIMLAAHDLNMVNGDFVFFNIALDASEVKGHRPWYDANSDFETNAKAKYAFRSLIMITTRLPDTKRYIDFTRKVEEKSMKYYQYAYQKRDATVCVGLCHDAVLLYAKALNETLYNNRSITDGAYITKKLWDTTFQGVTGDFSIDNNGDGYSDYSLLDMDQVSGDFKVVATFLGKNNTLVVNKQRQIDWVNKKNGPPPDTPKCGFDNSGCPHISPWVVAVITVVLITLVGAIATIIYIRKKFAIDLNTMDWKVSWDELETREMLQRRRSVKEHNQGGGIVKNSSFRAIEGFSFHPKMSRKSKKVKANHHSNTAQQQGHTRHNDSNNSGNNNNNIETERVSLLDQQRFNGSSNANNISLKSRNSIASMETFAGIQLSQLAATQMFAKTAIYRGNVVALKPMNLNNKSIPITELTLLEIKSVKDLNNNHIARFIGICLDSGNECIITEYCPKGSLQDVLETEQIKLDWMFRISLIQDMCRGMVYLQDSLGYHGNLKSSNCLVDSRFVLKITDFGLPTFRKINLDLMKNDFQYYKNKLWTAPELLREPTLGPLGLAKADVYSFAIVCQEIIYRSGVFFISDVDIINPDVVVNKVRDGGPNIFRPRLQLESDITLDMINLIKQCWSEDATQRPTFNQIKLRLRRMNNAGDVDILDNLLSRMEQYANNLESVVKQRTQQYLEEKHRAEDLLYSMLPRSVASQLIKGQPVEAVAYDSVTIYFSDICGFTELSASSTPMEVVTLLNALYTLFDSIIENYDVYKVETIGDAYMVVSGLPQKNGIMHVKEIANMSLAFLSDIFKFRIPHLPEKQLNMRIGIHTGMVCAGVVGLKMPRYCLFGDTVNTANRMESNGKPLKIHVSEDAKKLLDNFNTFVLTERGNVEMKGKGLQKTYWLHGTKDSIVDKIGYDPSEITSS